MGKILCVATDERPVPDGSDRLVGGRYRLGELLGSGAMGMVWSGRDERLGRAVVVKELALARGLPAAELAQARDRALREGRIAARLQHPNAVGVYDIVDDDGAVALILEHVAARNLAVVLAERGPLPPVEAARVGAQVASALAAAHEAGIVHRDVKPGNILVTDEDTVKLTDFGIARASGDITITEADALVGTPAFMSPEAARGEETTAASDVYSLGATLYAVVEGRSPVPSAASPVAVLQAIANGEILPAQRAGELGALLAHMLHADPAQRPPMHQVRDQLQAVADRVPIPAKATGPQRPAAGVSAPTLVGAPIPAELAAVPGPEGVSARWLTGRRRPVVLTVGAFIGVILLGLAIADVLGGFGGSGSGVGGQVGSSTESDPDPARQQRVVADYYALLPDRKEQAWQLLSPDLRALGIPRLEATWNEVDDLVIVSPPVFKDGHVDIGVEFTGPNGRTRQTHRLTLIELDGNVLIDSIEVIDTKPVGDDDKKDEDKKKEEKRGNEGGGN